MNDPIPNEFRKGPPALIDAVEPIAPGSKPHDMTNPDDIGDSLTILAENGDPISVYPSGTGEVLVARILSVHPEEPHWVLELNEGDALPPGNATFVTWLRSAKFQFALAREEWTPLPDQPNLIPLDFPEKCLVLNRRAAARLETPLGIYFTASFVMNGKPYELQLYDVSQGGIGMRCAPRDAQGLHVGRKLQRVRLELGPDAVIIADLEIRLSRTYRSFLLGEQVQIGCQFLNISPQMQEELTKQIDRMNSRHRR
ncbi:flagellar brake protein [Pseudoduganella namucuonensis]|uniref:C-di-GMP-binding flagellar brake protein YcgR, contains PilZNR and PilZ domains n=1 Tax=Pseudoduganella namucuonensis TaxID=1035707 RepID=A0A1I7L4A0_9BURK|nr:PilZ domain-containing protein [Pseudoduganella namucuonensis]SFV04531.1 c-di-GMP-binding flagellar brake protein YcgR, contains PilZNR and PilZ domains [Pseudoduganella namucuonensis]